MPLTQNQAYELLESAKERGRLGHAFLLTGGSGVGKRALAARIISMLNENEESGADLFGGEITSAKTEFSDESLDGLQSEFVRIVRPRSKSRLIRVDDMRELEESFYMSAPTGQWKIGVIVDADRMNESAANAFLKTLEEPPKNCLLLLLSTAPDRLLTTILSRCISIPLFNPDAGAMSPLQGEIGEMVAKTYQKNARTLAASLSLKTDFDLFLKAKKDELVKKHKALLKQETDHLKQVADKDFLREREDQAKAEEASEYLALRTNSVNALVCWFGDVLRWKVGHVPNTFKRATEVFLTFSEGLTVDDLLQRMEALEELRFLLTETNVSEALALETSFMKAFG